MQMEEVERGRERIVNGLLQEGAGAGTGAVAI
jgi:hypothetical protein